MRPSLSATEGAGCDDGLQQNAPALGRSGDRTKENVPADLKNDSSSIRRGSEEGGGARDASAIDGLSLTVDQLQKQCTDLQRKYSKIQRKYNNLRRKHNNLQTNYDSFDNEDDDHAVRNHSFLKPAHVVETQEGLFSLLDTSKPPNITADDDEEEEVFGYRLQESTFTFLFVSEFLSIPCITGLLIFLLKASIMLVFLVGVSAEDLFSDRTEADDGGVNINVDVVSSYTTDYGHYFAQIFAVFMVCLSQNDLIGALSMMFEGYPLHTPPQGDSPDQDNKGRVYRWRFAVVLMFVSGIYGTFVAVYLIASSKDALETFLNVAAVEFVILLDETAFIVASKGFFGSSNQECAEVIYKTRDKRVARSNCSQIVVYLTVLAAVYCLYGLLISCSLGLLRKCRFNPPFVRATFEEAPEICFVQFNDNSPNLAFHSGIYRKMAADTSDYMFVEVKRWHSESSSQGRFERNDHDGWEYYIDGSDHGVVSSTFQQTMFRFRTTRYRPEGDYATSDIISWVDCTSKYTEEDFCTNVRRNETCHTIVVDERFKFPPGRDGREIASTFTKVKNGQFYYKPVYENATTGDIIVYTGYRWALMNPNKGLPQHGFNLLSEFVIGGNDTYFALDVFGSVKVDFVSAPSSEPRFGTSCYQNELIDLEWFAVVEGLNLSDAKPALTARAVLHCADNQR